ncbi:uncharacterized protein RJT21DRAFT_133557 [Scheffersomyces amazonensis]|uniref:uncharacterized protein n=1 Tax=Scheffersomyces amazonensis TaxID=1078765 RepID=UPI00315D38B1
MDFNIITNSESISKESPIQLNDLVNFISSKLESSSSGIIDTQELNSLILKEYQSKSSKYKYLVQSTKLSSPIVDSDLTISSNFGAIWDSNKDGYISLKIE